jgi:hypothetical protein
MLRYATFTTPLCTGSELDGDAYLGVPSTFTPTLGVLFVVVVVFAPVVALALELVLEELDDPQPASNASAAHAISTVKPRLISGDPSEAPHLLHSPLP